MRSKGRRVLTPRLRCVAPVPRSSLPLHVFVVGTHCRFRPADEVLSFASPKERTQRKGDPGIAETPAKNDSARSFLGRAGLDPPNGLPGYAPRLTRPTTASVKLLRT